MPTEFFSTSDITTTRRNITLSDSGSLYLNKKMLIKKLILIFGIVDILLFFIHVCIFVHDRQVEKKNKQLETERGQVDSNNSMYDEVELVFL